MKTLAWRNFQKYQCPLCAAVLETAVIDGENFHACTNHLCGYKIRAEKFNSIVIGMDQASVHGSYTARARTVDGVIISITA